MGMKADIANARKRRETLATLPLTVEEKTRWSRMMHQTWAAIGADAEAIGNRLTRAVIVEFVCDANRVQAYGGMTPEEYEFLTAIYRKPAFQRWARKELNYV